MYIRLLLRITAVTVWFCFWAAIGRAQNDTSFISMPGVGYRYNGMGQVPIGLFGVHSSALDSAKAADWGIEHERYIYAGPSGVPTPISKGLKLLVDCYWDRYQPAHILNNRSGWVSYLEGLATTYANNTLASGQVRHFEFWNEPFLNWESIPGVNYDPRFYDSSNAFLGGPVTRLGEQQPEPHLIWKRSRWYKQLVPSSVNDWTNFYVTLGQRWTSLLNNQPLGSVFTIGSRTYQAIEAWMPDDTSTFSYYSGRQSALYYNRMYNVFATKIKSINPNIQMAAGWGMKLDIDNYRPWNIIYRPTIDSCIALMDGVHEHHYGGDSRATATQYEVVNAYSTTRYNKPLKCYNTEAGGFLDPQIPNVANPGRPNDPLAAARGGLTFTFRDISYLIAHCPDKAFTRAAHEAHLNDGDPNAFRMMKTLRGRLLYIQSNDPLVWAVAAHNVQDNLLTVCFFNDYSVSRKINMTLRSPKGTVFLPGYLTSFRDSSNGANLARLNTYVIAQDTLANLFFEVSQKNPRTLVLPLAGIADTVNHPAYEMMQFFCADILTEIPPQQQSSFVVRVPQAIRPFLRSAKVKIGVQNNPGSATLSFNGGAALPIPTANHINYVPIDISLLDTVNTIAISHSGSSNLQVRFLSIDASYQDAPALPGMPVVSSLPKNIAASTFIAFPNPTWDKVFFNASGLAGEKISIEVKDLTGRTLFSKTQEVPESETLELNLPVEMPAGWYSAQLKSNSKDLKTSFVKVR